MDSIPVLNRLCYLSVAEFGFLLFSFVLSSPDNKDRRIDIDWTSIQRESVGSRRLVDVDPIVLPSGRFRTQHSYYNLCFYILPPDLLVLVTCCVTLKLRLNASPQQGVCKDHVYCVMIFVSCYPQERAKCCLFEHRYGNVNLTKYSSLTAPEFVTSKWQYFLFCDIMHLSLKQSLLLMCLSRKFYTSIRPLDTKLPSWHWHANLWTAKDETSSTEKGEVQISWDLSRS